MLKTLKRELTQAEHDRQTPVLAASKEGAAASVVSAAAEGTVGDGETIDTAEGHDDLADATGDSSCTDDEDDDDDEHRSQDTR